MSTESKPITWESLLHSGAHWSGVLRRGMSLRLIDEAGSANVSALFYNFEDLTERYNMPDTLKAQHTAFLTTGCVCYSDMGRVLCSIVADSVGWHDPIGGFSNYDSVRALHGVARFQEARNEFYRNGYDSLLNEVAKYGLDRRDLSATVNFFSKVTVQSDGSMRFHESHTEAGDFVELRFEMNTLVVLSTCPHPLDSRPHYSPGRVRLQARYTGTAPALDACRDRCPENGRGFQNTEMLFA